MLQQLAQYLIERGADGAVFVEPQDKMGGHPFAVGYGKAVPLDWPEPEPFISPDRLDVSTLSGLVRALVANVDGWDRRKLVLVCQPASVSAWGVLEGQMKKRGLFVRAGYESPEERIVQKRVQAFRLSVVASFENTPERERLLEATPAFRSAGSCSTEEGASGMGLKYTRSENRVTGVVTELSAEEMVFQLSPYRTFPEAGKQEVVPFVLSIHGEEDEIPTGTLTDVGGNAWKAPAAERVGKHVEELDVEELCNAVEVPSTVVW